MTTTERSVTINHDQELYAIQGPDGGYTALGFDVCLERIHFVCLDLIMRGRLGADYMEGAKVKRGSLEAYDTLRNLQDMLRRAVEEDGQPAVCALSPQLVGLEGHRVKVTDKHGETRRFIVGKSSGWMPRHLEVARRDSTGGQPADREYESVTDLGEA